MSTQARLFDPDRHESVEGEAWDESRAAGAITQIAKSVAEAQDGDGYWPGDDPMRGTLYAGAAGILWAAKELATRRPGLEFSHFQQSELGEDAEVWQTFRTVFEEFSVPVSQSFLLGPVGALMVSWKSDQARNSLDRLDTLIGDNQSHPWMENLWGAPSTMLAAGHLYRATGQERFADHVRSGAAYLWDRLEDCEETGCRIWNINLYGKSMKLAGAGHGFVGNVFPVMRNLALFDPADQKKWTDLVVNTATKTAVVRGGLANWPQIVGKDPGLREGHRGKTLVHQCHGAPGFVIGLISRYGAGHSGFDELLLSAGELVWRAGPLKKYPGLCHGTPGNGYAFLKLWQATGDDMWLTRARAFAMAAIRQHGQNIKSGEPAQCSLWEGDMGLALYLADCIDGKSDFPTLDYF